MTLAQPPADPAGASIPAAYDPFWPALPAPAQPPTPWEAFGADAATGWPGAAAPAKSPSLPFGLGNFSLKDLQALVNRMGGIPGILDKIGKAQKLMQTLSQMAPMMKLLVRTFAGKSGSGDADAHPRRTRRRKRRRRAAAYGRCMSRRKRLKRSRVPSGSRRRRYRRRRRRRKKRP